MNKFFCFISMVVLSLLPEQLLAQGTTTQSTLSIENFSISGGETKELIIDLNNPDMEVWQMQFDFRLPEGLSIEKNAKGRFVTSKTERAEYHTLTLNENEGIVRFLLYTADESTIDGKSGALIKISIVAAETFKSGTISIENIKVTNLNNDKFTLPDVSLELKRLAATVTVNNQTRKYGEANPEFTYTIEPSTIDLKGKLTVTCEATQTSGVGEYAITATSSETSMDVTCVAGKLTVTPASLKVKAEDASRTYGAASPNVKLVYEGFVNNETEAVLTEKPTAVTTDTKESPVGTYDITVSGGKAANYSIDEYVKGTLTVTKAPLTVTAADANRVYGAENPAMSFAYDGFVNNETETVLTSAPVVSSSATALSSVGTYPIKVSGGAATNYSFNYVDGTLTVTKAPLKAAVKDAERVYGGSASYEFSYDGFVNGDTESALTTLPTVSTTATATSPVGTYDMTISGGEAVNYSFTEYTGGKLTITKAPLTVKADDVSWHVGSEWPAFTVSYNGFVNGETEAVMTELPVASTTATADSPVGTYPITVAGGEAQNYELSYVEGTLTIRDLGFEEEGANFEYLSENTVAFTGLKNGAAVEACEIPSFVEHAGNFYYVTSIAAKAFKNNTALKQVIIPQALETIGAEAFAGCTGLTELVVYATLPIKLSDASVFEGVNKASCVLYVPNNSIEDYKSADGWKAFQQILPVSTLGVNGITVGNQQLGNVYDMRGRKVRAAAVTLDGLPKGVYIINGRKVVK